jgi:CheY-like chemotaxis protein
MSNSRKVLIVGDDPVEMENFKEALTQKGHAVATAISGEDAVWQVNNDGYDAVVTSMILRGMSGAEVAEEVHASRPLLPVLLIGGQGSEDARARAAAAGVAEFLQRPLSPQQLAAAADRVLQFTKSAAALRAESSAAGDSRQPVMVRFALRVRDIVLFLLAPFLGLIYILALPIVGLGALVWFAFRSRGPASVKVEPRRSAASAGPGALKAIGMTIAVAASGVAYAVVVPILGIGLILWAGMQAWGRLGAKAIRA